MGGGGGESLINNKLQAENSIKTNDNLTAEVNVLDDAISANTKLANGVKYAVIAFDASGNRADGRVYEVGKISKPLKLDVGKAYNIIIYSFNNSRDLPVLSNINAKLLYSFANGTKEFLYHKISNYIASDDEKTLNITLKHRFSYFKIILDATNFPTHNNQDFISVSNVKLEDIHNESGEIDISRGLPHYTGKYDDMSIPMNKKSTKLYESDYIAAAGVRVNVFFRVYIVAPAEHGTGNILLYNLISPMKSGTRNTYTLKLTGQPDYISHIRPLDMKVYDGGRRSSKFPYGYNPDLWDYDEKTKKHKGFSVAKMKVANKFFPTTGFKEAEFDIIGSGTDQSIYRCKIASGSGAWVSLSGSGHEYTGVGEKCRVKFIEFKRSNLNLPVTIDMERGRGANSNWVKIDSYTINIPKKWARIHPYKTKSEYGRKYSYYEKNKSRNIEKYPVLRSCMGSGRWATNNDVTDEQAMGQRPQDRAFRQKYMYRRNEITNSPIADPIKYPENSSIYFDSNDIFSRDVDGTFMGEWGGILSYFDGGYGDNYYGDHFWTAEANDDNYQIAVNYSGKVYPIHKKEEVSYMCRDDDN